jgi:PAS domain S-box-containing protein
MPAPWLIPLIALLVYGALLNILALRRRWSGVLERSFALYLIAASVVSICYAASYGYWAFEEIHAFILRVQLYAQAVLSLSFFVFARSFTLTQARDASARVEQKSWVFFVGLLLLAALIAVDLIRFSLDLRIGVITAAAVIFILRVLLWLLTTGAIVALGASEYTRATSPIYRNRLAYLALALSLLVVCDALELIVGEPARTLGLVLQMVGVLILAYATLRHHLADLRYLIRQGIRYILLTTFTILVYALVIQATQTLLRDADPWGGLAGVLAASVGLALFYQPLRDLIQGRIEALLFGRRYTVQAVVQSFSQQLSALIDLDQLAQEGRRFLRQAIGARDAALLVASRDESGAILRPLPAQPDFPKTIRIDAISAVTDAMTTRATPLLQYDIDRLPQFARLSPDARLTLQKLQSEVYVPILSRGALIGVWGVGAKMSGEHYTNADLALLQTLADQSAVALENARLLADLREQVLQVRSMRDHLDSTLASIVTGVLTLNREGKIISFNRAAEEIFRIPATGAIGQSYERVLPPLEGAQLPLLLARLWAESTQHLVRDAVAQVAGRGQVHLSVHLSTIRRGEEMTGVALVIEDLTDQARLEQERRAQEQETQRVRETFEHYVAPTVVEGLLTDPRRIALGGERQLVTILFADIHGFTKLSEKLPPEELVHVLNGYLSLAYHTVLRYEGTLDKFMGDGVMAIFNAPLPQADHAWRAACAALALRREVAAYAAQLPESWRLYFRTGLHTGEAVVGNIGARELMNYTAVGDTVNVAKRLQENADGNQILLSRSTHALVEDRVVVRPREALTVKGRATPVGVFELVGAWEERAVKREA